MIIKDLNRDTIKPVVELKKVWEAIRPRLPREFRVPARRPEDLLVFDILFYNLRLVGGTPPKLVRGGSDAYIVAELPPQSLGEQAFLDATGGEQGAQPYNKEVSDDPGYPKKNVPTASAEAIGPLPSAKVRMAGSSRIAFNMPGDRSDLPYTLTAVLEAFRTWPMRLDFNAAPEPERKIIEARPRPGDVYTADRAWLKTVTQSPDWIGTTSSLMDALTRAGAGQATRPLAEAAARLAQRTATALAGRPMRGLEERLRRDMAAEVEALSARVPQIREQALTDTVLAGLALEMIRGLAASRLDFAFDPSIIGLIFAPHEPSPSVTAIELPYRLIMSPIQPGRWLHRDQAFEAGGRTELWHTRLTTSNTDFGPDAPAKVRALWSPDYAIEDILPLLDPVAPYRMSLDPLDRKMLVKLMAGFNEKSALGSTYSPRASIARRLMLSALGGLLDAEGNWSTRPAGVGLEQWRHLATLGRDHYVRVVYAGFLCPFGHAASLIKVTERKFEYLDQPNKKNRIAALRQRFFIVVRERIKEFRGGGHAFAGRNFPFQSVEILTRVTPNLRPPESCKVTEAPGKPIYDANVPPRAAFWPMVAPGTDYPFKIVATDIAGSRVAFAMPLLFVGDEANQAKAGAVIAGYNKSDGPSRRTTSMGSAIVCYAPVNPGAEGDPRLPTAEMTFDAAAVTGVSILSPQFYPETESAKVGIRAVQKLLGQNNAVIDVKYPDVYKQSGFGGPNPGEVFLQALSDYSLEFGGGANQAKSDALGALATPSMAIQGLSRIMGPASDLANVTNNTFDPTKFFKDARILGGIPLSDLLSVVSALVGADVPKMLSRELPDRIEASFNWKTEIKNSDPLGLFVPKADGSNPTPFEVKGLVTTPIANPAAVTYEANASLQNFKVNLFGFIILWFDTLKFVAKAGSKPDVSVDMNSKDAVMFGGPLEFVNDLRKYIPIKGFSDPPSLSVTPSGITASYSLGLPSIEVGIFALSNLSLGAGFSLPFDSNPALVKFNFCERQSPFCLTVSFLGGGGFFALGLGTEGVREIEAALEFGAGVSIDLGVASGGVEIKAGVYFHWLESAGSKTVELTGYVRLHGELSILGLISASLTFNLQISYLKEGGASTVWGEAELTIEIEILFFSTSVSVKCRREFGGSASDPRVIDLIPDKTTWLTYCAAFAEEVA